MKKMTMVTAGLALVLGVTVAAAQTRPAPPSEAQPPAGTHAPEHQSQQPMMGPGQMGHGQGMVGMMCPMMGMGPGMMSGGMMSGGGMMGGMMATADPKAQARMLKLRGDMMKAMGDVFLKHAQEIEQAK